MSSTSTGDFDDILNEVLPNEFPDFLEPHSFSESEASLDVDLSPEIPSSSSSKSTMSFWCRLFLSSVYLLASISGSIGLLFMTYYMPIYPSMLNYVPSFLSGVVMTTIAISMCEFRNYCHCCQDRGNCIFGCFVIGALCLVNCANCVLIQAAIVFVDPVVFQITIQMSTPLCYVFSLVFLRSKETKGVFGSTLIGHSIVLVGILITSGFSYYFGDTGSRSKFSNSVFWICIMLVVAFTVAINLVLSECAFRKLKLPRFSIVSLCCFVSSLAGVLWIFATTSEVFGMCPSSETVCFDVAVSLKTSACLVSDGSVWSHQLDALKCLVGFPWGRTRGKMDEESIAQISSTDNNTVSLLSSFLAGSVTDPCCGDGMIGPFWMVVFVVSFVITNGIIVIFLSVSPSRSPSRSGSGGENEEESDSETGTNTIGNLNGISFLGTSLVMSIPWIAGSFVTEFRFYTLIGFLLIALGTILSENQKFFLRIFGDVRLFCCYWDNQDDGLEIQIAAERRPRPVERREVVFCCIRAIEVVVQDEEDS